MRKSTLFVLALLLMAVCLPTFGTNPHNQVPILVAQQSFTGQTAAISTITLFSPSATDSKEYRVSAYMNAASGATGNAKLNITYTDDYALQIQSVVVGSIGGAMNQQTFVLHVAPSTSITMDVSIPGGGSVTYDVHVSLEEL